MLLNPAGSIYVQQPYSYSPAGSTVIAIRLHCVIVHDYTVYAVLKCKITDYGLTNSVTDMNTATDTNITDGTELH